MAPGVPDGGEQFVQEQRNVELAFRHLERALRHGGPGLFTPRWLDADPELAPLRSPRDVFDAPADEYTTAGP